MLVETRDGWDATSVNLWAPPPGQGAGYTTGGPGIAWTDAQWAAHPDAVRICQDAGATDRTADILDVETGAATPDDAPSWYQDALKHWKTGTRPGQRHPAIYCNPSTLPAIGRAFAAAKPKTDPWIWEARWGLGYAGAVAAIQTDIGSYHQVAIQYETHRQYDSDVWAVPWLNDVSKTPAPPAPPDPDPTTGDIVSDLPTVKQGDTGEHVRTVQGLLVARGYELGNTGALGDGIDGDFGPDTATAVRHLQERVKIDADSTVGPETWQALLAIRPA